MVRMLQTDRHDLKKVAHKCVNVATYFCYCITVFIAQQPSLQQHYPTTIFNIKEDHELNRK